MMERTASQFLSAFSTPWIESFKPGGRITSIEGGSKRATPDSGLLYKSSSTDRLDQCSTQRDQMLAWHSDDYVSTTLRDSRRKSPPYTEMPHSADLLAELNKVLSHTHTGVALSPGLR